MQAYTVTASNRAFWQTLVVVAYTRHEAAEKFHAFLTEPVALAEEVAEYEAAKDAEIRIDREEFRYGFSDFDIALYKTDPRWIGTPTKTVQMIAAGANG